MDGTVNANGLLLSNAPTYTRQELVVIPKQKSAQKRQRIVKKGDNKGEVEAGLYARHQDKVGTTAKAPTTNLTKQRLSNKGTDQLLVEVKDHIFSKKIHAQIGTKYLHQLNQTEQLERISLIIRGIKSNKSNPLYSKVNLVDDDDIKLGLDFDGCALASLQYLLKTSNCQLLRKHTLGEKPFPFIETLLTAWMSASSNDFQSSTIQLRPRTGNEVSYAKLASLCIVTKDDDLMSGCKSRPVAGRQLFGADRKNTKKPVESAFNRSSNLTKSPKDNTILLRLVAGSAYYVRNPKPGEMIGTTELGKRYLFDVDGHGFDIKPSAKKKGKKSRKT